MILSSKGEQGPHLADMAHEAIRQEDDAFAGAARR